MMRFRALLVTLALLFAGAAVAQTVSGGGVPLANGTTVPGIVKCDGSTTTCTNGVITATAGGSAGITQITGDLAAGPGTGSQAGTLATVNAGPGAVGSSTAIPVITTNGKGLVTSQSTAAVVAPAGTLSGTTLNATVVNSSLISTGTLAGGATGAGFTVNLGASTVSGVLPSANGGGGAVTGIVKATAGVTSAAVAGTDYQAPLTLSSGSANLLVSGSPGNSPSISSTVASNVQSGASYTIVVGDATKTVLRTNTGGAETDTLPNVSTTGFGAGFGFTICTESSQQDTISVTSPSTLNGASSLVIPANTCVSISDPDGLNYVALAQNYNATLITTGTLPAAQLPAHGSGDVSCGAAGGACTIANNAVTNAKAAQMAAHTIKGNNTGGTANAADLTDAQVAAELPAFVGDSGAGGTKGLVPAPASGDAAAGKFLKADNTWAVPAGGGGGSGTVTTTGTPANGNLAKFSGATAITNGDISGDCTTSGALAITCTKTSGSAFAASATTDTTNAANISSGLLGLARGGTNADLSATGGTSRFLKQATTGAAVTVVQPACGDLSNAAASCATDATNATNISSGTLAKARGGTAGATGSAAATNLSLTYKLTESHVTSTAVTGTTSETKLISAQIPANTLGANGSIRFYMLAKKVGTAGAVTFGVRFGAANDLTGTSLASVGNFMGAGSLSAIANGKISNRNATNSQISPPIVTFASSTTTVSTAAIDTTAATWLVLSVTPANSGDSITSEDFEVWIDPAGGN